MLLGSKVEGKTKTTKSQCNIVLIVKKKLKIIKLLVIRRGDILFITNFTKSHPVAIVKQDSLYYQNTDFFQANIVFDADRLRPGVYRAEITVLTNDPFNSSATIPVELTVTGRPGGTEALDLEKLVLVDAETDQILKTLEDGDVYDLNELPDITVAAVPMDPHFKGSIAFYIDGEFIQRERVAPYALAGDDPRGDYNPYDFAPGDYMLEAVLFTKEGERISSLYARFSVVEGSSAVAKTKLNNAKTSGISYEAYPNPVTRSFKVQTTSEAIAHYALIDNLGRVLTANPVDNRSTVEVDMTPYLSKIRSAGIFYLKVITQSGRSETIRMRVE